MTDVFMEMEEGTSSLFRLSDDRGEMLSVFEGVFPSRSVRLLEDAFVKESPIAEDPQEELPEEDGWLAAVEEEEDEED